MRPFGGRDPGANPGGAIFIRVTFKNIFSGLVLMATKKLTKKEAEDIIRDLYKEGLTSEKIGLALKNKYNIKKFREEYGIRISEIIGKKDADLRNIKQRLEKLQKHFGKNPKDQPTKRRLTKTTSQLRGIEKYLSR